MQIDTSIPAELRSYLKEISEPVLFVVRSRYRLSNNWFVFIFAVLWLVSSMLIVVAFFWQLLSSDMFKNNIRILTFENMSEILLQFAMLLFFLFVGFVLLRIGIRYFIKKDAWFIATSSRLIVGYNNQYIALSWSDFVKVEKYNDDIVLMTRTTMPKNLLNGSRLSRMDKLLISKPAQPELVYQVCKKHIV